jgi:hypothetical protein
MNTVLILIQALGWVFLIGGLAALYDFGTREDQ